MKISQFNVKADSNFFIDGLPAKAIHLAVPAGLLGAFYWLLEQGVSRQGIFSKNQMPALVIIE